VKIQGPKNPCHSQGVLQEKLSENIHALIFFCETALYLKTALILKKGAKNAPHT
jgi:hypothetical protein